MPATLRAAAAVATLLALPVAAQAQAAPPRFVVSVGGGAQFAGDDISDRREFEVNVEAASSESRHPFETGGLVDGGIGVRLWRRLGAGVSVSHFSADGSVAVTARIPHPFQFNAHREISGTSAGAQRTETGVHGQVQVHLPLGGRLRTIAFAGPSFITASQDVVREVRYEETFPFDTATFTSAELSSASGSGLGFNAGVDAFWMFTARFAAGGLLRFARASLDLDAPDDRRVSHEAGGVHVAVGVRALF